VQERLRALMGIEGGHAIETRWPDPAPVLSTRRALHDADLEQTMMGGRRARSRATNGPDGFWQRRRARA